MFKKLLILCTLLITTHNLFSIKVYLENKQIDGELLLSNRNKYFVKVDDNLYIINRKIVKNLDKFKDNEMDILLERSSKKKINYFFFKNVIKMNKKHLNGIFLTQKEKKHYIYPNIKFLPISFISFALTYDYLKEASEIKKVIEDLEELNIKPEKSLKRKMERKITLGYIFLGTGIINTFISFNRVELHADLNELWLSYKF